METRIPIYIPSYQEGTSEDFRYWIITEKKFPTSLVRGGKKLPYEIEFINVPNIKDCATSLEIVCCECSSLITYKSDGKFYTIPDHNEELYGQPIFEDKECSRDVEHLWDCPQNYFPMKATAEAMLDYLKSTYGCFTSDELYDFYDYIAPYGHFN